MICSSLNRLRLIVRLLWGDGLYPILEECLTASPSRMLHRHLTLLTAPTASTVVPEAIRRSVATKPDNPGGLGRKVFGAYSDCR